MAAVEIGVSEKVRRKLHLNYMISITRLAAATERYPPFLQLGYNSILISYSSFLFFYLLLGRKSILPFD